jgi:hypothetical protein
MSAINGFELTAESCLNHGVLKEIKIQTNKVGILLLPHYAIPETEETFGSGD